MAQTLDNDGADPGSAAGAMARERVSPAQAITLLLSLGLVYVMSHFYRTALAVIAPEVGADLGLTPGELGFLNGAYFIAFAVAQIPAGIMLDRFGPRRVISGMMLVTVLGTILIGLSSSYGLALIGRLMQGAGCSAVLMGSFVVFARWFPQRYFAALGAAVLFIGGMGNLLSASPLAYGSQAFGWRESFLFAGVLTLVLVVQMVLIVRDAPPGTQPPRSQGERPGQVLAGLVAVVKTRYVPSLFAMNFVAYAAIITVIGLWAGPWLADTYGLGTDERGNVLTLVHIGVLAGYACAAPLDRWLDTRKRIVFTTSIVSIAGYAVLALADGLPLTVAVALLVLLGMMGSANVILLSHIRALFPVDRVGRGMSVLNVAVMAGVACLQTLTGWLIGFFPQVDGHIPQDAYRAVFVVCGAALALGLSAYAFVPDAKPSQVRD
ncbi:MAG: MFS transporter [Sneathiellaceae bacterium]